MSFSRVLYKIRQSVYCFFICILAWFFSYNFVFSQTNSGSNTGTNQAESSIRTKKNTTTAKAKKQKKGTSSKKSRLEKLKGLRISLGLGVSTLYFSSLHGFNILETALTALPQSGIDIDIIDRENTFYKGFLLPVGIEIDLNVEYNIPKAPFLMFRFGFNSIIYGGKEDKTTIKPYNALKSEFISKPLVRSITSGLKGPVPENSPFLFLFEEDRTTPKSLGFVQAINAILQGVNNALGPNLGIPLFGQLDDSPNADIAFEFEDKIIGVINAASLLLTGFDLNVTLPLKELVFETKSRGFQLEIPFLFGFNLFESKKGAFYILFGISYMYSSLFVSEKGVAPLANTPLANEIVSQNEFFTQINIFNIDGNDLNIQVSNVEFSNTFISHSLGLGVVVGGRFSITKNVYMFTELKIMYSQAIANIKKSRSSIGVVSDFSSAVNAIIEAIEGEDADILNQPLLYGLQLLQSTGALDLIALLNSFEGPLNSLFYDLKTEDFFQYEPVELNPNPLIFRFVLGVGYGF